MDQVTYTPDEFAELVARHPSLLKFPILLRGAHGIGKSAAPRSLSKQLGLPLIERRISQMSEGDFLGLPVQNPISNASDYNPPKEFSGMNSSTADFVPTATTRFSPPDWFWQACTTPVVLFLDEVGRGTHELRQAVMQLLDSRTLAGMVLHPGTVIIAADNSGESEDLASYNVQPMDAALLSRFVVFDIELTKQAWLHWANTRIRPEITKFIRTCSGTIANEPHYPLYLRNNAVNRVTPCPRTWERLNGVLAPILESPGYKNRTPETLHDIHRLAAPFIGAMTASELVTALREKENLLTYEDIVSEGKYPQPDAEVPYMQGLVQGILAAHGEQKLTYEQADRIMEFLLILTDELTATLYFGFASRKKGKEDVVEWNCRLLTGKDGEGKPRVISQEDPYTKEVRNPVPLVLAKIAGVTSAKTC